MKTIVLSIFLVFFSFGNQISANQIQNTNNLIAVDYEHCLINYDITFALGLLAGFDAVRSRDMADNAYDYCVDAHDREQAHYWNNN